MKNEAKHNDGNEICMEKQHKATSSKFKMT